MGQNKLSDARKYEELTEPSIQPEERPVYHFSARVGWLNDPNGFSYYQGSYHLFYQYHPYSPYWGPMHWGHAVTKDFLHWEYLPAVLAPDMPYDQGGCFSGGAAELSDGRHLLMYTGVSGDVLENGEQKNLQVQCLAVGDGRDYEKYEGNPVLTAADLPAGGSPYDFRDPKVWKEPDGTYRCVTVNNETDGSGGRILLYQSKDCFHWNFLSEMIANHNKFGKMWECPDFFSLDGKDVVLVSPQDMLREEPEYHNGDGNLCFIGTFDRHTNLFIPEHDQAIDYGIDFYAAQTLKSSDGRRIMIGWMQNWDNCSNNRIPRGKWFGQMTIPRELFILNARLYQWPVREIEALRINQVEHKFARFSGKMIFTDLEGRIADIELTIRPGDVKQIYHKFMIQVACGEGYHTDINFRPHESVLEIDRSFSGSRRAILHQRSCLVNTKNGELKLRILLDRFSVEVFVNGGEQAMTASIETKPEASGISFLADGSVEIDVVKYEISSYQN